MTQVNAMCNHVSSCDGGGGRFGTDEEKGMWVEAEMMLLLFEDGGGGRKLRKPDGH